MLIDIVLSTINTECRNNGHCANGSYDEGYLLSVINANFFNNANCADCRHSESHSCQVSLCSVSICGIALMLIIEI